MKFLISMNNKAPIGIFDSGLGGLTVLQKIQDIYAERQSYITKRAKKFAELVRKKYALSKTPFHILLQKALAYKKKYNLKDEEFEEFRRRCCFL